MIGHVVIHEEVQDAIAVGRPIVALESAVLTTGLPREPLAEPDCKPPGWRHDQPMNLELGRLMARLVRAGGGVPATVGVLDGELRIGLEPSDMQRLAEEVREKVSVGTLSFALATGASAGTTVSATLAACGLTSQPIRVFATGGIGGVHRNWAAVPDVSADLRQIAVTPTCVVCAGAKSILDLPATLEVLETLGVTVIGYGTDVFPQFHSRGGVGLPVPHRLDDLGSVARVCSIKWNLFGTTPSAASGVVLANPIQEQYAMDTAEVDRAVDAVERETGDAASSSGAARTPYLLSALAKHTQGRSLQANIALLMHNAKVATDLAREIVAQSQ